MMMTVMSRPPQRPSLYSRGPKRGKEKLPPAGSLEGAVGEVAMVKPGDREHTDKVETQG